MKVFKHSDASHSWELVLWNFENVRIESKQQSTLRESI